MKDLNGKKLGVVGSRTFKDYSLMKKELDKISISAIVSGMAIGADSLAEKYAHENNISKVIFPPNWLRHGKKAGYIRNKKIVEFSDMIIAFWNGKSKGTKITIDLAKEKGNLYKIISFKEQ